MSQPASNNRTQLLYGAPLSILKTNKANFLVINKADLVPDKARLLWSNFFKSKQIAHVFFSAKDQQEEIELAKEKEAEEAAEREEQRRIAEERVEDRMDGGVDSELGVNPFGVLGELKKEDMVQEELEKEAKEENNQGDLEENPKEENENEKKNENENEIKDVVESQSNENDDQNSINEAPKVDEAITKNRPVLALVNTSKIVNRNELIKIFKIFKTEFDQRTSEMDKNRKVKADWQSVGLQTIPEEEINRTDLNQSGQTQETQQTTEDKSTNANNDQKQDMQTANAHENTIDNAQSGLGSEITNSTHTKTSSASKPKNKQSKPISKKQKKKLAKQKRNLKNFMGRVCKFKKPEFTIGMVGFPNVGKSSLINTLCEEKKVGVDSKPGKTKNLQTIELEKGLTLCDCPGLVMPSLASSSAEMVCKGVLPISNLVGFVDPVRYMMDVSDYKQMSNQYFLPNQDDEGKMWKPQAREMLQIFAASRGVLTGGSGVPDEHRAAKLLLGDLVDGKIKYFKLPPIQEESTEHTQDENIVENEKDSEQNQEKIENLNNKAEQNENENMNIGNNESSPSSREALLQSCFDSMPGERRIITLAEVQKTFKNVDIKDIDTFAKKLEEAQGDEQLREHQEKLLLAQFIDSLTGADIEALMKGRKVGDYKLNKTQRRGLKFAVTSGQKYEDLEKLLTGFLSGSAVKGKKKTRSGKGKAKGKRKQRKYKVQM